MSAESKRLHREIADRGRPEAERALAVEALLELGYPHALEVHPADLALFRSWELDRKRARPGARLAVTLLGVFSLVWSGAWTFFFTAVALEGHRSAWPETLLGLAFAVATAHAVLAMRAALSRRSPGSPAHFGWLARMFWCGPVFSVVAAMVARDLSLLVIGLIWAAPAMATAIACVAARATYPTA